MKKSLLLGAALFFCAVHAQVGIGTSTPNASSILDVNVNSLPANGKKGLLLPQVALKSTTDLTTIPNPANGLMVYNTADAGTAPDNVHLDTFYKFNKTKNKWSRIYDEDMELKVPVLGAILGFKKTGNDTTYLGPDISGGSQIRQILFDDIKLASPSIATFNPTTKEFVANRSGYYNFQINVVLKGPFDGYARIGVSKPYTGSIPPQGNGSVSFFTQFYFSNITSSLPVTLSTNGIIHIDAGQKVIFMTRYVDPTVTTLNVESIAYDRTQVSSVNVTFIPD